MSGLLPFGSAPYNQNKDTIHVVNSPATSARNVIQPTGASIVPLTLKGAASQSADLTQWQDSGGNPLALVNSSGKFSRPNGFTSSEQFGATANATDSYSVAFGDLAVTTGDATSAFGYNSFANTQSTALGVNSSASTFSTAVGGSCYANGPCFVMGYNARSNYQSVYMMGLNLDSTATNQFLVGSRDVIYAPTDVYIGGGVTNPTPVNTTYHATSGSGTNIAGGTITIAGGQGTGTGAGGPVVFQTSSAGSSGTTLASLVTRASIPVNGASLNIPSGTAPTSPVEGDMWADSTQKAVINYTDGIKQARPGVIFTQTADSTVTNTVTETSVIGTGVGTMTLPAASLVAGKTIRLRIGGVYTTPSLATPSLIIKVKLGTTVIATVTTSSLLSGATNLEFDGEVDITCRSTGVSGTVIVHGDIEYSTGVAGTIAVDSLNNGGATTTVDTTASKLIDVTVQWDSATSTRSVKSTITTVEILN